MTNGEVDLDKAIKENPNNNYLKEYKKIAVENGITPWGELGTRLVSLIFDISTAEVFNGNRCLTENSGDSLPINISASKEFIS